MLRMNTWIKNSGTKQVHRQLENLICIDSVIHSISFDWTFFFFECIYSEEKTFFWSIFKLFLMQLWFSTHPTSSRMQESIFLWFLSFEFYYDLHSPKWPDECKRHEGMNNVGIWILSCLLCKKYWNINLHNFWYLSDCGIKRNI